VDQAAEDESSSNDEEQKDMKVIVEDAGSPKLNLRQS
jgi:hypothetical protein